MALDLLSFPEEEGLEFEVAIIQVVQTKTGQNLVTSRLCVHNKISAAFMKACSVVRVAAFFGGLFYCQMAKRNAFLPFARCHFFTLFCLFVAG